MLESPEIKEEILWQELAIEATEEQSQDFSEALFPVQFRGRTTGERYLHWISSGFLPLTVYLLFLIGYGASKVPDQGRWVALLLCLPIALVLGRLLYPLFIVTERQDAYRAWTAALLTGLTVPLFLALAEAALGPDQRQQSFAMNAARNYTYFSVPGTALNKVLISLLVGVTLWFGTRWFLQKTPWYDPKPMTRARWVTCSVVLLSPLFVYMALAVAAVPSSAVVSWEQTVRSGAQPKTQWSFVTDRTRFKIWRELVLRNHRRNKAETGLKATFEDQREHEKRVLETLRSGVVSSRTDWVVDDSLESLIAKPDQLKQPVEVAAWLITRGLSSGGIAERNKGFSYFTSSLLSRSMNMDHLELMESKLTELLSTLPNNTERLNAALVNDRKDYPQWRAGLWLLGQLESKGVGPEYLAKLCYLNDCTELWLRVQEELGANVTLDQVLENQNEPEIPLSARELVEQLNQKTKGLSSSRLASSYLDLRSSYKAHLEHNLVLCRLKRYRIENGRYPNDMKGIEPENSQPYRWSILITGGKNYLTDRFLRPDMPVTVSLP